MVATYDIDIGTEAFSIPSDVRLSELEDRLDRGYRMIEERQAAGLATDRHEEHWVRLLAEYEALHDKLR